MPEKKKNHYIPKMILANFSNINNNINFYNVDSGDKKENVPYGSQCQKDYFYGKNNGIEDELGTLETNTSPIFQRIIKMTDKFELLQTEYDTFIEFIATLKVRTKSDFIQTQNMFKELKKNIDKPNSIFSPQVKEILEYKIEPSMLIKIGKQQSNIYKDLSVVLLSNTTDIDFVLTDSPIFAYNFFLEPNVYKITSLGIADTGLILFIPISPKKIVMIYDNEIYKLNCTEKKIIKINDEKIIKDMNAYSVLNCENMVYFLPGINFEKQIRWLEKIKKRYTFAKESSDLLTNEINNEIIHLKYIPSNFRLTIPFIRVKKEYAEIPINQRIKKNRPHVEKYCKKFL